MKRGRVGLGACLAVAVLGVALFSHAAERGAAPRDLAPRTHALRGADLAESFALKSGWAQEIESGTDAIVDIGRAVTLGRPGGMYGFDREVLVEGIAHYTADIPVGEGAYDVIRIHRVVRELEPYRPIRTGKNIFLLLLLLPLLMSMNAEPRICPASLNFTRSSSPKKTASP